MNKNFGMSVLILCFGISSVDVARATQIIEVAPVIVQPEDLRDISQQMLERDRENRDQELAIRGLIDDNQKLTDTVVARKQDAALEKINQTMANYRDSLIYRDRARIMDNSQRVSRYDDLIHLTEDVDGVKGVGDTLILKRDVIEEKYKILNDLKDEMTTLNEKLKGEEVHQNSEQMSQQERKIQLLTQRLAEMDQRIAHYDEILAEKDQQIAQLKVNLSKVQSQAMDKDEVIKNLENQIAVLKAQSQDLSSRGERIKSQADQMAKSKAIGVMELPPVIVQPSGVNQQVQNTDVQAEFITIRNKMKQQDLDLTARNESIRWLNQVLAVAKNKAEYYKLSSQQDHLAMEQVQAEVQNIKDDFARQFKDYDQLENSIVSLKNQVGRLGLQLSQKQTQVDLLTDQNQREIQVQQRLKAELQNKENQIDSMKADIQAILQGQANKEIYLRKAEAQVDDRVQLARQLIDLQQQETALLDEKNNLAVAQNNLFEQHALRLESKIKGLLANHQVQTAVLQNRFEELKNELYQKEEQVSLLKRELENKITEEKNQSVLAEQIQDLKAQLQDKENQMMVMKATIVSDQDTQAQLDTLKQQMAEQQNKAGLLKQELDRKIAESNKMSLMMEDYQKKLESKDNAYNEELRLVLSTKDDQALMQSQIAGLNVKLQEKEAQVVKIKKDMYDLQELTNARDKDTQAHDLSLSMMQQKMVDEKINEYQEKVNGLQASNAQQVQEVANLKAELAMARQQLEGMPSSDEMDFLRAGLKKSTAQLKQRDGMLAEIKANADEYAKEFKQQTQEFQSLKDQLLKAQGEIDRNNEDLKYKNMAIARFKDQLSKTHENKLGTLQEQLKKANFQIGFLQYQLDQLRSPSKTKNDPIDVKLKQALDKINEQGRVISALSQKLHDAGQNVDLVHDTRK